MTARLHDLADANLVQSIRVHAAWQTPCELVERDGILLMAGSSTFPGAFRNCVARTDPAVAPAMVLRRAREFFDERSRNFTVYIRASRDADLEQQVLAEGYTFRAESPCMLVDAPVPVPAVPDGIHIETVSEPRHIEDAMRIN